MPARPHHAGHFDKGSRDVGHIAQGKAGDDRVESAIRKGQVQRVASHKSKRGPDSLCLLLGSTATTLAHGAQIEYTVGLLVEIQATYDSGEPMAGGQVTIYAPGDPTTPWATGVCDEEGSFLFRPDPGQPGTWDVQVRQAGHGDMVHIDIAEGMAGSGGGGFTTAQILLMAACVGWGFVGTALYFSRRPKSQSKRGRA